MNYRYNLDKSSRKFVCPNCNKKTFVLFIDTVTGKYAPSQYGRCDREAKCGYFKTFGSKEQNQSFKPPPPRPDTYIPNSVLTSTLNSYAKNSFIQNLLKKYHMPRFKV
jgi:hypothetical protein